LLPRDNRVLREAAPERILEALTGVRLAPGALRALLAGCHSPSTPPTGGETIGDRWAHLTFSGPGNEVYLRRDGTEWHLVGVTVDNVGFEYDDFSGSHPRRVRVRTHGSSPTPIYDRRRNRDERADRCAVAGRTCRPTREPLTLDELRGRAARER
jgi:hypothetical protein